MRKSLVLVFAAVAVLALAIAIPRTFAGNAHFVEVSIARSGNTLSASGKIAGLGDEPQVHVVLTFNAACINPGSHHPNAANKESFSAEGDFPVQNGKAEFSLSATATFKPDCTPPMSLVFSDAQVCDVTHNICQTLAIP